MGRKATSIAVIAPKKVVQATESPVERRVRDDRTKSVAEFKTLPDQIAKSSIYFKNWYCPELREKYNFLDRMKRIDRVYPYAKLSENGAPTMLLVDEPATDYDIEICSKKLTVMQKLGYKYCYVEKDSTVYDLLSQLGVV
jgi:hypothetical protein